MKLSHIFLPALFFAHLIFGLPVHSQTLHEIVTRFDSSSALTYKMTVKQKDLFSDQIVYDSIHVMFPVPGNRDIFKVTGTRAEEIYDGTKLIKLDLDHFTYRIARDIENSVFLQQSIPRIMSSLKKDIQSNAPTRNLNDTLIDGEYYCRLEITELDTIKKEKRVFRIAQLVVDKKSYLPVFYKSSQQGFIDGTDLFIDTYSEMRFYDYQFNPMGFPDLSALHIPSKFEMEKPQVPKILLSKGIKSPDLKLRDEKGKLFNLASQKGKVVLLNFTLNSCSHCVESITMLNSLNNKYAKHKFELVTINPFDSEEAVKRHNSKYNVTYPIYVSGEGSDNIDNYQVDAYPTFYLIDKRGNVIKGFNGYYKALDKELIKLINDNL